jgi:Ribosomal protein L23
MKTAQSILLKPIITEKSTTLRETQNVLTFKVATDANRIEIRRAVEVLFDVKVDSVRVLKTTSKIKKVGAPSVARARGGRPT